MSELCFDRVEVRYGAGRHAITAVDSVSLTVPSGRVVGLVGESGSGKSTLARAAVGLTRFAAGRITIDGVGIGQARRRQAARQIQMVFQDPYASLDPRMSIGESISEAIPRRRIAGRTARQGEISRLLELVNLDSQRADVLPGLLSGGQRQRVALARALAAQPSVLIADEITSALDVSVQGAVLNVLCNIQRELALTMLFISHNLAVVRYVSDVIAVMYLGRLVEVGPADAVLADPQHPYTRELLAAASRKTGRDLESALPTAIAAAEPPDPHHPPRGCHFHPRCPIGPLSYPDRQACRDESPALAASNGSGHQAACHFTHAQPVPEHRPSGE